MDIVVVLGVVISDTQNNLPVSKMLIFPLTTVVVILMTVFLISKLEGSFLEKILTNKYTLLIFLSSYFILLAVLSVGSRAVPDNDHYEVYKGALYVAKLTEESNWEYFARCDNNIIPMLVLSVIIRINQFLGFPKPYILPVLLNAFQVIIAMFCVYKLLQKHNKRRCGFILPWAGIGYTVFFFL